MDMKKFFGLLLGVALCATGIFTKVNEDGLSVKTLENKEISAIAEEKKDVSVYPNLGISSKAAFSMDAESGTVIYAANENQRLPIASMCKIMTLILSFDAIKEGSLLLEEKIKVSERAASMGGSQVFLEAGGEYPVFELLKSIVVCSANDSCVAMAERLCGGELPFTEKMNERAKSLGAENTLFANCTGLPKEPQYSSAKDVALFLRELTKHEEYFKFAKIWTDRFQHPKGRYTDISNTNRLVRFYDGCDGGKTGFTNQAGFCLAATAKRGGMRIISVVIGGETSDKRFQDVRSMFDYAFATFTLKTTVDCNNLLNERAEVSSGKVKSISVRPQRSSYIFSKKGEEQALQIEIKMKDKVKAPVKVGDKVGEIVVYQNSVEIDRIGIVANEQVEKAGFYDRLKEIAENYKF